MPWLYYGLLSGESAQIIAAKEPNLQLDVTPGSFFSQLPLVLAVYDIQGRFLGFQNLTTDLQVSYFHVDLQFCDDDTELKDTWRSAGVDYHLSCEINIASFLNSDSYSMNLYDLCINIFSNYKDIVDSTGSLYDIPVRLRNYRLSDGTKVNINSNNYDYSNNQFFRRFFTFDGITGVRSNVLSHIRLPVYIKFWYFF